MQLDYSDIYDIAAFFIGSPEGRVPGRDDLAKQIAEQGRAFAMDHWRWEDMQAYVSVYLVLRFIMSSSHAHPHTYTPRCTDSCSSIVDSWPRIGTNGRLAVKSFKRISKPKQLKLNWTRLNELERPRVGCLSGSGSRTSLL